MEEILRSPEGLRILDKELEFLSHAEPIPRIEKNNYFEKAAWRNKYKNNSLYPVFKWIWNN